MFQIGVEHLVQHIYLANSFRTGILVIGNHNAKSKWKHF